jgi:hypothetical protein
MLQDAISCSLEILGAEGLQKTKGNRFILPNLETRRGGDPRWMSTLDTLRTPPEQGRRDYEWRRQAAIRPVTFEAPEGIDDTVVQLHLSHRLVQRLLGRFSAQGFVYDDLSRACFANAADAIPRVVLLGRLSVYGPHASRLHEEIISITARWSPVEGRTKPLTPFGVEGEKTTLELLQKNMAPGGARDVTPAVQSQLLAAMPRDVEELHAHLQPRGENALAEAVKKLTARGEAESNELTRILQDQKKRVLQNLDKNKNWQQLELGLNDDEARQKESDVKTWESWIANVEGDLQREPARIREFYAVKSHRIEPVGLVYLMPSIP